MEDLGEFVAWLRLPPAGRDVNVSLLPAAEYHCSEATVNRKLTAVGGFCVFHARHGVDLGELVTELRPAGVRRGGWRPFLYHLSAGKPERRKTIKLQAPRKHPMVLTATQAQAILDGCTRLRDRFLFVVMWETGARIGEVLGLRHADIAASEGELHITRRVNDNHARAKSATSRRVPIGPEVVRLYADYLHTEYGGLDSDYVFVNLWSSPYGHPLAYAAVYDLVRRLRRVVGFDFDPHWFRHTRATLWMRQGVSPEVVSKLLGHSSLQTTTDIYGHLSVEDARRALEDAGFFTGAEVAW